MMNRRNLLKNVAGGAMIAALAKTESGVFADEKGKKDFDGPAQGGIGGKKLKKLENNLFYNKGGSFNEAAAKDAYVELFRFHRFSLGSSLLENSSSISMCGDHFWATDFNLSDFANTGMGGIVLVNNKEFGYFGHDMFLLPFQMIPEHFHLSAEGRPAKHESWQVRHGSVWTFSEGGNRSELAKYPPEVLHALKSHLDKKALKSFNGVELKVGDMTGLAGLEQPHFMIAGPEGAIVTEYATFHSGEGLRFSHPDGKAGNTPAKF